MDEVEATRSYRRNMANSNDDDSCYDETKKAWVMGGRKKGRKKSRKLQLQHRSTSRSSRGQDLMEMSEESIGHGYYEQLAAKKKVKSVSQYITRL